MADDRQPAGVLHAAPTSPTSQGGTSPERPSDVEPYSGERRSASLWRSAPRVMLARGGYPGGRRHDPIPCFGCFPGRRRRGVPGGYAVLAWGVGLPARPPAVSAIHARPVEGAPSASSSVGSSMARQVLVRAGVSRSDDGRRPRRGGEWPCAPIVAWPSVPSSPPWAGSPGVPATDYLASPPLRPSRQCSSPPRRRWRPPSTTATTRPAPHPPRARVPVGLVAGPGRSAVTAVQQPPYSPAWTKTRPTQGTSSWTLPPQRRRSRDVPGAVDVTASCGSASLAPGVTYTQGVVVPATGPRQGVGQFRTPSGPASSPWPAVWSLRPHRRLGRGEFDHPGRGSDLYVVDGDLHPGNVTDYDPTSTWTCTTRC